MLNFSFRQCLRTAITLVVLLFNTATLFADWSSRVVGDFVVTLFPSPGRAPVELKLIAPPIPGPNGMFVHVRIADGKTTVADEYVLTVMYKSADGSKFVVSRTLTPGRDGVAHGFIRGDVDDPLTVELVAVVAPPQEVRE